jgi:4a-hydroxytetrahydrobiopterin dehydratase
MAHAQPDEQLSRTTASEAVEAIGWRYLLGTLVASVQVPSMEDGVEVATAATRACGPDADGHLRMDLRPDRVELSVQTRALSAVTTRDVRLAHRIASAMETLERRVAKATAAASARPVEMLEIAIDAMDINAIRPFWKAVLAYADEPGSTDANGIVDPAGQLPTLWFQQMDVPRPQRNRVHFDITVAHDEAASRVQRALEAGGTLLDDSSAQSFWILADEEGNEVCVCTWLDRDERGK